MNKFYLGAASLFVCVLFAGVLTGAGTVVNTPGIPAGAIMAFGGATCPQGWLAADGTARATATYPALDAHLATTWGARAGGNFQTPDLRGVFPKGAGTTTRAAGVASDGATYYAGTLGTYQTDKTQTHTHRFEVMTGGTLGNAASNTRISGTPSIYTAGFTTSLVLADANTPIGSMITASSGAPRTGATTEPQSAAVTYCIKY